MEKNWVKIFTSTNFYQSEIVKQVLTGHHIDAVLLNRQASSHQALAILKFTFTRKILAPPLK
jgi:hypothetical protein